MDIPTLTPPRDLSEATTDVFTRDIAAVVAHSYLWPAEKNAVFMRSTLARHQDYADQWRRAQDQMRQLAPSDRLCAVRLLLEVNAARTVREISGSLYYAETMDRLRDLGVPAAIGLFQHDQTSLALEHANKEAA